MIVTSFRFIASIFDRKSVTQLQHSMQNECAKRKILAFSRKCPSSMGLCECVSLCFLIGEIFL
jgi:hypothetical protein